MASYAERLDANVIRRGNPVVVGLDPRLEQLPRSIIERSKSHSSPAEQVAAAFEEFCCRIIDVVAPLVPAVKPQSAFFEELGPAGSAVLARVIRKARDAGLIVICDAKRGDIGSTAEAYARAYLAGEDPDAAPYAADALTVSPYLGRDTLEPFVKLSAERGAGIYVLVRTSNPGATSFQNLKGASGKPLYHEVAQVVEQLSLETSAGYAYGAVGAVVGATYPQELNELRAVMPHAPLLIPGYGSQGGRGADIPGAFAGDGRGAVVNSSRGIIFAYERKDYSQRFAPDHWEQAVEAATREMIADLAENTPAGNLRP